MVVTSVVRTTDRVGIGMWVSHVSGADTPADVTWGSSFRYKVCSKVIEPQKLCGAWKVKESSRHRKIHESHSVSYTQAGLAE